MDRVKVLHAISFECMALYLVFTSAQFKSLTTERYMNFLWSIAILTVIFCLPMFYFSFKIYSDSVHHAAQGRDGTQMAAKTWIDWGMHHLVRSDMGAFGFGVAVFIHLNIYFFLFCLAGMA